MTSYRKPRRIRIAPLRSDAEGAMRLLRATFGPSYPPAIAGLMEQIQRGLDAPSARTLPSRYGFDRLLTESPLTIPPQPDGSTKNAAHSWAYYHGRRVVTRTAPTGETVVWLVGDRG